MEPRTNRGASKVQEYERPDVYFGEMTVDSDFGRALKCLDVDERAIDNACGNYILITFSGILHEHHDPQGVGKSEMVYTHGARIDYIMGPCVLFWSSLAGEFLLDLSACLVAFWRDASYPCSL